MMGHLASIHMAIILAALEQWPQMLLTRMTEVMGLTKCLHHPTPGMFLCYILVLSYFIKTVMGK